MSPNQVKEVKVIQTEKKKLMKYLIRSQKAITRDIKALKKLERKQEILLNPILPGLDLKESE